MSITRRLLVIASCAGVVLAGCSSAERTAPDAGVTTTVTGATTVPPAATTMASESTAPPATALTATVPPTTVPSTTAASTTAASTTAASTTLPSPGTPYGMPVADGAHAGYAHEHHDYPASDVFVGCGAQIIAPVNATVLESRRVDGWSQAVDNPATRGGKSISLLGDDGVRYYFAHLDSIELAIEPGARVVIGQPLGLMGRTGRAGACHLHFAISPPCPGKEWSVRRGVIWPWRYLDAWRRGEQLSPLPEIEQWVAAHPDACAQAMADPNAPDS